MKIVLLFILLRSVGCAAFYACCDENNNFYALGACLDGKPFRIDCREAYELRVNDSEIHYEIDKAGALVIYPDSPIPPGQYCYSRQNTTEEEYFVICFPEQPLVDVASTTINTIFQFVSVTFIVLTILVYLSVPEMQNLQGIITIHSISGLASSFLFLGYLQCSGTLDDVFCHIVAYLLYFSFLYAFFWLNALCFHIWKEVIQPKCLRKIRNWRVVYYIYGIGGPLTFLMILLVADNADIPLLSSVHPGIAEGKCWFRSIKETFIYFYGPIAILLLSNIVYFVWTATVLWNQYHKTQKTKELKYRLQLYSKLFFIMGITWVFEVVSAALDHHGSYLKFIWLVSDALNALEGLIIFLILVVFRKGVLRSLAKRTWCCGYITFPEKWRAKDDESVVEEEMINFSI